MERSKALTLLAFLLLCFAFLLLCSCSTTIIYSPKNVCTHSGGDAKVDSVIKGSELQGNAAKQEASGKLKIPVMP